MFKLFISSLLLLVVFTFPVSAGISRQQTTVICMTPDLFENGAKKMELQLLISSVNPEYNTTSIIAKDKDGAIHVLIKDNKTNEVCVLDVMETPKTHNDKLKDIMTPKTNL